jgi:glycosyltransferase involved in cell wall biosynthesis
VLITSEHVSQSTGKLYEYLASGRPVIALAGDNEAARIVRETGVGITIGLDDEAAIAAALRQVARGEAFAHVGRDTSRVAEYVYPGPAQAMAELVGAAVSARLLHSRRS